MSVDESPGHCMNTNFSRRGGPDWVENSDGGKRKGSPNTKPGRPFGTPSVKLASSLSAYPNLRPSLRKGTVRVTAASRETSETSSRDIADSRPLNVKLQSKKLEKHVTTAFSDRHFSKSKNASSGVVSIMMMPASCGEEPTVSVDRTAEAIPTRKSRLHAMVCGGEISLKATQPPALCHPVHSETSSAFVRRRFVHNLYPSGR